MSQVIDEKVVSMRFDNGQFESGARTTLGTLGKLKSALNFGKASEGVQETTSKFDALKVAAGVALGNIATRAISAGATLTKSFTLDPIIEGFHEYELQINSIQTMLSNTTGESVKSINKYLDQLNTYADKTIYNFAEMTRNIGTFTAAGVDLKTSVTAIKGISNLAAASGSSSQQASTAMYQLSQALATGTVRLMDWNSVVNAGMGGRKFQEALKQTAREHGVAVDEMIKKNGSFRDSLQEGWLSAEIMTDTLKKFTVDGAKKYTKAMVESGKMTQEQADAIIKEAKAMEDAATKVRTFSQLVSTVKEAIGSGWAQTFRILFGDFKEATKLFTRINDVISGAVNKTSNARNKMLQGWKDLGGRKVLIEGLTNAFNGLVSVLSPIKKAFQNIFPPTTSKQLYEMTKGFRDLTSHFKLSAQQSENLQKTFEGLFGIFKILFNVVSTVAHVLGSVLFAVFGSLSGPVLTLTGSIGSLISKLAEGTTNVGKFIKAASAKFSLPGFDNLQKVLQTIGDALNTAFDKIGKVLKKAFEVIGKAFKGIFNGFSKNGISTIAGFINLFGSIGVVKVIKEFGDLLVLVKDKIQNIGKAFKQAAEDVKKGLSLNDTLQNLESTLELYQRRLKADILIRIATAVAILSVSVVALSIIDPNRLTGAITAMAFLMTELYVFTKKINKIIDDTKNADKTVKNMIRISVAVLILANALVKIGELPFQNIMGGLVGLAGIFTEIGVFTKVMDNLDIKKFTKGAGQLILLAVAINLMAGAVKILGSMKPESMFQGLMGVAAALGTLLGFVAIFQNIEGGSKGMIAIAFSITQIAIGLIILSNAVSTLGSMKPEAMFQGLIGIAGALGSILLFVAAINAIGMNPAALIAASAGIIGLAIGVKILSSSVIALGSLKPESLVQGLIGIAGALLIVVAAAKLMSKSLSGAGALIVAAIGVQQIAMAMALMSGLGAGGIVTSLVGLGGALLILSVGLQAMSGGLAGAAVLLVAAVAIGVLGASLALIASIGIEGILTAFIGLAGAITIFAVAAALLSPLLVPMALLAGVLLLLGVAIAAIGGGLILVGNGLQSIVIAFQMWVTTMGSIFAAIGALFGGLGSMLSGAFSGISGFFSRVGSAIAGFGPRVVSGVGGIFRSAGSAISNGAGQIAGAVRNITSQIVNAARGIIDGFRDAGRNAVEGLIHGITSKAGAAIKKAQDLADNISKRIRKAWDEHSPSKLTQGFGANYVLGLPIGFIKKEHVAVQAIEKVANHISDALVDNISDDDLNPVITPVLDLTDVNSGVDTMSSMLSDSNYTMSAGLTATSDIQNGMSTMANAIGGLARKMSDKNAMSEPITINVYGAEGQSAAAIAREVRNQFDEIIRLGDMIS